MLKRFDMAKLRGAILVDHVLSLEPELLNYA
jgi:hypothetical protein